MNQELNQKPATNPASGRNAWVVLIVIVVALAALAIWRSATDAKSMSGAAASDEKQFSDTAPGSKAKFAMEITQVPSDRLIRGKLLQKKAEELYTRTGTVVTVRSSETTDVVMGKASDIRAAAVVHVTGTVRDDRSVQAEQIVVLTGYVKVQ